MEALQDMDKTVIKEVEKIFICQMLAERTRASMTTTTIVETCQASNQFYNGTDVTRGNAELIS